MDHITHLQLEMTVLKMFSDMPARNLVYVICENLLSQLMIRLMQRFLWMACVAGFFYKTWHADNICIIVISSRSCPVGYVDKQKADPSCMLPPQWIQNKLTHPFTIYELNTPAQIVPELESELSIKMTWCPSQNGIQIL